MFLSLRVIDLIAGATLVGVVGGGVVTVTTGLDASSPSTAVPVSSTVIDDPAPPTELVSADPFVLPGSEERALKDDQRRRAATRDRRAADRGSDVRAAAARGEFAPHTGLGSGATRGSARSVAPGSGSGSGGGSGSAAGSAQGTSSAATTVPEPPATATTEVVVSSFNVLGSSHTRGKKGRRGFAAGTTRAGFAAQLVQDRGVDLVGFQELERDQARVVVNRLPGYAMYPGPQKRQHASSNSIMWRTDTWRTVETHTIGIPYFNGNIIQMPYVRLQNLATGTDVWVANFHNPASVKRRGDQSRWRAEATRRQVELANRLRAESGLPVIFTGDFNEREVYFCRLVGATELEASNGGTVSDGRCAPPRAARIDWVFGTPELSWLSSIVDQSPLVRRTTDHPMIVARAQLRVTL